MICIAVRRAVAAISDGLNSRNSVLICICKQSCYADDNSAVTLPDSMSSSVLSRYVYLSKKGRGPSDRRSKSRTSKILSSSLIILFSVIFLRNEGGSILIVYSKHGFTGSDSFAAIMRLTVASRARCGASSPITVSYFKNLSMIEHDRKNVSIE